MSCSPRRGDRGPGTGGGGGGGANGRGTRLPEGQTNFLSAGPEAVAARSHLPACGEASLARRGARRGAGARAVLSEPLRPTLAAPAARPPAFRKARRGLHSPCFAATARGWPGSHNNAMMFWRQEAPSWPRMKDFLCLKLQEYPPTSPVQMQTSQLGRTNG